MLLYRYLCRWLASFALFLTWLPLVAANEPAHALEKVAYYFVYRSAVDAYGEKQKKWAPGLARSAGSHPDKGANFKEFLQFLLTGSNWADSDFKNAGVDLNDPDPEKATKFLLAKGGASQVPAQLLRPKADAKYWTQVAKGRKVLQKSWASMMRDGKPASALEGNKNKILTLLNEVAVVRGSDVLNSQPNVPANKAKGLLTDMPKLIKGAKLVLDQTTWKWDSSRTIYTPNLAKTLAASSPGAFSDPAAVEKVVREYGMLQDVNLKRDPAYTHYQVHKAYRFWGKWLTKRC